MTFFCSHNLPKLSVFDGEGGNYSEEVIGKREEVFCERHKVGLTHFVLISFLENVFHKLVRWLSGKRSTGGAGFRFLKVRRVFFFAPTGWG